MKEVKIENKYNLINDYISIQSNLSYSVLYTSDNSYSSSGVDALLHNNTYDKMTQNEFDTATGGGQTASVNPVVDLIYPVGAVYISVNSTSPATLFGGTWEAMNSGSVVKLPVSDSDFGVYAGSSAHTPLASKEQNRLKFVRSIGTEPSGVHNLYIEGADMFYDSSTYSYSDNNSIYPSNLYANENSRVHLSVYMWKRTA